MKGFKWLSFLYKFIPDLFHHFAFYIPWFRVNKLRHLLEVCSSGPNSAKYNLIGFKSPESTEDVRCENSLSSRWVCTHIIFRTAIVYILMQKITVVWFDDILKWILWDIIFIKCQIWLRLDLYFNKRSRDFSLLMDILAESSGIVQSLRSYK